MSTRERYAYLRVRGGSLLELQRRREKGFVLTELLTVLLLLSVLTLTVTTNVAGMFSYGSEQAWEADKRIIETAVILFYSDIHKHDSTSGWNEMTGTEGHYYPTANGQPSSFNILELLAVASADVDPQNYFNNGTNGAVWMGLLVYSPGLADASDPEIPGGSSPMIGENGPYFHGFPESCSTNNGNAVGGTYTWVVTKGGTLYGVYWDGAAWREGFSGRYP